MGESDIAKALGELNRNFGARGGAGAEKKTADRVPCSPEEMEAVRAGAGVLGEKRVIADKVLAEALESLPPADRAAARRLLETLPSAAKRVEEELSRENPGTVLLDMVAKMNLPDWMGAPRTRILDNLERGMKRLTPGIPSEASGGVFVRFDQAYWLLRGLGVSEVSDLTEEQFSRLGKDGLLKRMGASGDYSHKSISLPGVGSVRVSIFFREGFGRDNASDCEIVISAPSEVTQLICDPARGPVIRPGR